MNKTNIEKPVCPECGASKTLEIVHGTPTYEAIELILAGELVMGDGECRIGAPIWRCDECGHEWGELSVDD